MLYKRKVCVIFWILARGRLEPQGIMRSIMCWKALGNNAEFGEGLLYWECGKIGFAKKTFVVYVGTIWGFSFFRENIIHSSVGGKEKKNTKARLPCSSQPYVMHAEYLLLVPGKPYPKTGRVSKYWRSDTLRLFTHTSLQSLFRACFCL